MANLIDLDLGSERGSKLYSELESLLSSLKTSKPQKIQIDVSLKDDATKEFQKHLNKLNADQLGDALKNAFSEAAKYATELNKKINEGYRPTNEDLKKLYASAGRAYSQRNADVLEKITARAYSRRNSSLGGFGSEESYRGILEENIRLMKEAKAVRDQLNASMIQETATALKQSAEEASGNEEIRKSVQNVVDALSEEEKKLNDLGVAIARFYKASMAGDTEGADKSLRDVADAMAEMARVAGSLDTGTLERIPEFLNDITGYKGSGGGTGNGFGGSIRQSTEEVEKLLSKIKELESEKESLINDRYSAESASYGEFEQRLEAEAKLDELQKEHRQTLDELAIAQERLQSYMDDFYRSESKLDDAEDALIEKERELARAQEALANSREALSSGSGQGASQEGQWLNVLEQIRDTLISISKAIGNVADEEGGVNSLINQFERLDEVLSEIQKKVGTGIINVELGGSAQGKAADDAIDQEWTKLLQTLRRKYDRLLDRFNKEQLNVFTYIYQKNYADKQLPDTLADIENRYKRSSLESDSSAKQQVANYMRFFDELKSLKTMYDKQIKELGGREKLDDGTYKYFGRLGERYKQLAELEASLKSTPSSEKGNLKNQIQETKESINAIKERIRTLKELSDEIGSVGVNTNLAGREKKINAIRDQFNPDTEKLQEEIAAQAEKANEEVKAEVSNLDAVINALAEVKQSVDKILESILELKNIDFAESIRESIDSANSRIEELIANLSEVMRLQKGTPTSHVDATADMLKIRRQAIQEYKISLQEEKIALEQAKKAQDAYIESQKKAGEKTRANRDTARSNDAKSEESVTNAIQAQNEAYKKMWGYRVDIAKLESDLKKDHSYEIELLKEREEGQKRIVQEKQQEIIASGKILNIQDRITKLNSLSANPKSQIENYQERARDVMSNYAADQLAKLSTLKRRGNWTEEYSNRLNRAIDETKRFISVLSSLNFDEARSQFRDFQNVIDETIGDKALKRNKAPLETQLTNLQKKISQITAQNTAMGSEFQKKWENLKLRLDNTQSMEALSEIAAEVNRLSADMNNAGKTGMRFIDMFGKRLKSLNATFLSRYLSFYDIIRYSKFAVNSIRELDTALVDLKKTAKMSGAELESFYLASNDIARQMGVTTKEIIEQASSWSRLGYNTADAASKMAKLSSQFASISPGMNTEEAQTGLVSIMKAWDVSVDKVQRDIMDNINTLGNNFALTNKDIIDGMERAGATLSAIGMDTKDSFALFTGANEVIQNAETVGTAIKTLSLRIRGYDEETEELSDDVIEATGKVADLTKVASNNFAGVSLWADAAQTQYRSLVDYLGDISKIWDEIDAKSQTQLLEKLFGKRGASVGSAILQNFDQVEAALVAMESAAGSSEREMEIIRQSIDYKLNNLKETWVGTFQDILNREDIGNIVDGLAKLSEGLGWVVEKLGVFGSIGAGVGIYQFFKNLGKPKRRVLELGRDLSNLPLIDGFRLRYA